MLSYVLLGPVLTAIFLAIVILCVILFGKWLILLIINSAIGIVALILVNILPVVNIQINIWSILIVVLGGIPGFMLLIILDVLKIAF
ncbi:MAG: pro-sigmaK processing inhibitor BofA family protein [Candidatus Diapherotrites archaeon]|nr:pro-sigmaK processing inhibitor BofA family protein [Candidatus Diapherotrites archaeon]